LQENPELLTELEKAVRVKVASMEKPRSFAETPQAAELDDFEEFEA